CAFISHQRPEWKILNARNNCHFRKGHVPQLGVREWNWLQGNHISVRATLLGGLAFFDKPHLFLVEASGQEIDDPLKALEITAFVQRVGIVNSPISRLIPLRRINSSNAVVCVIYLRYWRVYFG